MLRVLVGAMALLVACAEAEPDRAVFEDPAPAARNSERAPKRAASRAVDAKQLVSYAVSTGMLYTWLATWRRSLELMCASGRMALATLACH